MDGNTHRAPLSRQEAETKIHDLEEQVALLQYQNYAFG